MKPSELTYITQDIIDKGGINVTSPEMMDEVRHYNMDAVTNNAKRKRVRRRSMSGTFYCLNTKQSECFLCIKVI